jgi:hypothetical protein
MIIHNGEKSNQNFANQNFSSRTLNAMLDMIQLFVDGHTGLYTMNTMDIRNTCEHMGTTDKLPICNKMEPVWVQKPIRR